MSPCSWTSVVSARLDVSDWSNTLWSPKESDAQLSLTLPLGGRSQSDADIQQRRSKSWSSSTDSLWNSASSQQHVAEKKTIKLSQLLLVLKSRTFLLLSDFYFYILKRNFIHVSVCKYQNSRGSELTLGNEVYCSRKHSRVSALLIRKPAVMSIKALVRSSWVVYIHKLLLRK